MRADLLRAALALLTVGARGLHGVAAVIEVHHKNTDAISHNVDFHAVTGPGGGGPCLLAEQGEEKVGHFRLLQPGLFIYHCAAAPVPAHVANGMYGLLMVDPEDGLPPVDREFFVVQSEIYAEPSETDPTLLEYSHEAGLREQPRMVVFNGREGALTEAPLVCKQGERVRIFVGNAGPNLVSSFHVIGSVFDKVYREGDAITPPSKGVAVTLVPAGGASIVEFDAVVPGNYTIVDHSIFRIEKGAVGFIKVLGPDPRADVYASNAMPIPCPGCKLHN